MMLKITKYIIFLFSLTLFFVIYSGRQQNMLKIIFCDVGQGDATLLVFGQFQMLVDAGPNNSVLQCLDKNIPLWDKSIEYFVLTHMDSDHIGGATSILERYNVDFLFMNPSTKQTSDFELLEQVVSRKNANNTQVITTYLGQKIRVFDSFEAQVISPQFTFPQVERLKKPGTETILSDKTDDTNTEKLAKISENDLSIGLKVVFKDVFVVLPGDLEKDSELAIIKGGLLNTTTVLKAGHHGSKSSSTPEFIEVLQPEIAIISSGKNNAYNHPDPRVLKTFSDFLTIVFQTKISGELHFASDGTRIWECSGSLTDFLRC